MRLILTVRKIADFGLDINKAQFSNRNTKINQGEVLGYCKVLTVSKSLSYRLYGSCPIIELTPYDLIFTPSNSSIKELINPSPENLEEIKNSEIERAKSLQARLQLATSLRDKLTVALQDPTVTSEFHVRPAYNSHGGNHLSMSRVREGHYLDTSVPKLVLATF